MPEDYAEWNTRMRAAAADKGAEVDPAARRAHAARQAARELIVHPTWQAFVDGCVGTRRQHEATIRNLQAHLASEGFVGVAVEEARLRLLYHRGAAEAIEAMLEMITSLVSEGENDARTGRTEQAARQ